MVLPGPRGRVRSRRVAPGFPRRRRAGVSVSHATESTLRPVGDSGSLLSGTNRTVLNHCGQTGGSTSTGRRGGGSTARSAAGGARHSLGCMRAWVVHEPGPVATGPLRLIDRPVPEPGPGQLLIKVLRCGVCRTDLHLTEGDLPPKAPDVTPGHEVVGEVVAAGPGVSRFGVGDRVGAAWLAGTDGSCRFCRSGRENLCPNSIYTGWDIHGGYAEYLVAADAYVYELPKGFSDAELAPLLCAGIIGYRALKLADLPPGGRLANWPASLASLRRRTPSTPRRSRSTRRSCSLPSAPWCRRRWPHWTAAARWPSPGST